MRLSRKIKRIFTGSPYTREERRAARFASSDYLSEARYWQGTGREYLSDEELLAMSHEDARKAYSEFYLRRLDDWPLRW